MGKVSFSFDEDIAKQYDVHTAIILQNIEFWQHKNIANNHNLNDGKYWVYNSRTAFENLFSFISARQIRTSLEKLEKSGILITGNYNKDKRDRTKWYSSTRICSNGQNTHVAFDNSDNCDLSQESNANDSIDQPLPVINPTVINPVISQKEKSEKDFSEPLSNVSIEIPLNFPEVESKNKKRKKTAPKKENQKIDFEGVQKAFNLIVENSGIPKIKSFTDKRKSALRKLLKDFDMDQIGNVIRKSTESDFLTGSNGRQFVANFDWIVNQNNFIKIMEGNYENKEFKKSNKLNGNEKIQEANRQTLNNMMKTKGF